MRWKKFLLPFLVCVVVISSILWFAFRKTDQDVSAKSTDPMPTTSTLPIETIPQPTQNMQPVETGAANEPDTNPEMNATPSTPEAEPTEPPFVEGVKVYGSAPKQGAKPAVAITFDDGPSLTTTPRLLDVLKEKDVKATFFVLGFNFRSDKYHQVLSRMANEGHEIENHSFAHKDLTQLSSKEIREDLLSNVNIIKNSGGSGKFLRPPYGRYNNTVLYLCKYYGYNIVTWNVDTEDWKHKDDREQAQQIADKALEGIKDGDIILMHDIYETSVDAAALLIDGLKEKGFDILTVEELINR